MKRISIKEYLLILVAAVFLAHPATLLADDSELNRTPGFWKTHGGKTWLKTGLDPNDRFASVFTVDSTLSLKTTFDPTLLDVLKAGGGGTNALGRHAVAALLNASLPNSSYPYTPDEIKMAVIETLSQYQAALFYEADISTDMDNIESLKDMYEALNENR
jgi:hypothetical protein